MQRRKFLQYGLSWPLLGALGLPATSLGTEGQLLRIALLHLAPEAGALDRNRADLARALAAAAKEGAQWVITPELYVSGYTFADLTGTDWINPQPDTWLESFQELVAQHGVTVFLGLPERDAETRQLHNSLLVIGPDGTILGQHRKIRTLSTGSEAWSTPGNTATVVAIPPYDRVGLMICSDAYAPQIARDLKDQGAEILVSAANWAPGLYGPSGEWEQNTLDTGLPLIVCNRTGVGRSLDFTHAQSVVVRDGRRLHSLSSAEPAIFLLDWLINGAQPAGEPVTLTGFLS